MMRWILLAMWCCAALVSQGWTAESVGQPWVVKNAVHGVVVGSEWDDVESVRVPMSAQLNGKSLVTAITLDRQRAIVTAIVPPGCASGDVRIQVGKAVQVVSVAALPSPTEPAALIIIDAHQPCDEQQFAAVKQVVGDRPLAVVLVGMGRAERLRHFSWLNQVPIIALGRASDDKEWQRLAPGTIADSGTTWGVIGLPTAQYEAEWPRAVARDVSAWSLPVVTAPLWDPSLFGSPQAANGQFAKPMISLAMGLAMPLIIQTGSRVGFITEPLANASNGLATTVGGVRFIGATPMGDGIAGLDRTIAVAAEDVGLCVISADRDVLDITMVGADYLVPLQYKRGDRPSGGWGGAGVDVAWHAFRQGEPMVNGFAWAIEPSYTLLTVSGLDRQKLIDVAAADPLARLAAQRILVDPSRAIGIDEPVWMTRTRILRELGQGTIRPGSVAYTEIQTTTDVRLVHAAIRCADGRGRSVILMALAHRLSLQAAGSVPFAANPLDQHRLVAAVFDAVDQSPTDIRVLARALTGKVDPLSQGPIDRFVAIYGEYRKP